MLPVQKNNFAIIELDESQIDAVVEISRDSGLSYWSAESYKEEINKQDTIAYAACLENNVIGFVLIRLIAPDEAEVLNFAVRKDHRRKGTGTKLFEKAIARAAASFKTKKFWLEVRESNFPARRFYERIGFREVDKRKNFYALPTEHAILMILEV